MKLKQPLFRPFLGLTLFLTLLILGVVLLSRPGQPTTETITARIAQAKLLGLTGPAYERYIAEPGLEDEDGFLLYQGDYWATRYTYPTGQYDQRWLLQALQEDAQVLRGVPAGQILYTLEGNPSPLTLDPNQFTSLGPQPLQSDGCLSCFSYGHVAGRTNVIAVDPIQTNVAYFGSDGGGVWKTTNCCTPTTTWTPVTDDPLISTIAIGDMVIDPNDHNTVYAGTGDLRYGSFSFGSAGLLKSTDQGTTWTVLGADVFGPARPQPAGNFPQYQAIGKVQVDPRNSNNVIVGTKTGLYFSYDAGNNWTGPCYTNAFTTQRQDTTGLLISDNGTSTDLYAAIGTRGFATTVQGDLSLTGANGVYKTTVPASGCPATWTLLNTGWPAGTGDGDPANDQVGRIDLAMAPSDHNIIYAQIGSNINSSATLGVYKTSDGGNTWVLQASPGDFTGCGSGVGQTWYNAGITVDPNNPNNVFLSMIDLFRSTNGGDTFVNLTCGYAGGNDVHVDHHSRAFVGGSSSMLLVGSDGGIYLTTNADVANPDSVAFSQLNDSLSTIEFYSGDITANFATSAQPGVNAGAQDNGSAVYVWNDGMPDPAMWQLRKGGDGMYARIEPAVGLRWYQESQNGNLAVSLTGPYGNQQSATGGWTADRKSFVFPYEIYKYCPDPGPCTHLIAGSYRVWETIQGGIPTSSWYINSPDLTKNTLGDRSFINQLAYATTDQSVAIVGTNDGNVQYGFNLGQGVANSATWVNVTDSNAILPNRPILDVAIDPVNPLIGYVAVGGFDQNTPATPGHVFQVTCTANCASFTWLDKSGNLPNIPADSIIANPLNAKQIFVGTDWGLYYTDDVTVASPTWQRFQAGLPNVMIWDMAVDRGNTTLALFTRSRGAYVWPLPAATAYSATLGPDSDQTTLPMTTVVHSFTLENTGADDSYNLAVSGNSWTTTLLTATPISLTAGMTATIEVEVQVPDAPYTSDSFTLTAVSVGDPNLSLTATGTTHAEVNPGVAVSGDLAQTGYGGQVLTYTVTITNSGDYTDTFDITLGSFNWATTTSTTSVTLAAGDSATVEIYVTVGVGSSDSVTVTATSTLDNSVSDVVTLTSSQYLLFLPVMAKP